MKKYKERASTSKDSNMKMIKVNADIHYRLQQIKVEQRLKFLPETIAYLIKLYSENKRL